MKTLFKWNWVWMAVCGTLCAIWACSEEPDCSMTARPMLNANIYTVNVETGLGERDTLEQLTITALGTDSVIVNSLTQVRELSLPLRYTVDSTVFVLHYDARTRDTIVLSHSNTPYFLSMDCGYQMQQALTGVGYTRNVLDSIYVSNSEIGIYGTENLQLFY